jgi:hypothetical protein
MLPKLKELNLNYFQVDGIRGQVSKWVHQGLEEFLETHINDMTHRVKIKNCWMPWNRMFEVGLEVNVVVKD